MLSPLGAPFPLSALQIGDQVMTLDPQTYEPRSTEIIAFLHRDEHQYSPWIELTFSQKFDSTLSTLRLTANHLIYRWRGVKSTVFANQIRPGDEILCNLERPDLLCRVHSTQVVNSTLTETGVFAPLTASGDILIDGVFVSCYAHIQNEWLARITTLPFYRIAPWFGLNFQEIHTGVHQYVGFIIPDQLFSL